MRLEISLSPDGGLRLHLPSGHARYLDISVSTTEKCTCTECGETTRVPIEPASLKAIRRILRDAASGKRDAPGYIGEFPTQAVIDAWMKQKEEESIAAASERLGVDLAALEITL